MTDRLLDPAPPGPPPVQPPAIDPDAVKRWWDMYNTAVASWPMPAKITGAFAIGLGVLVVYLWSTSAAVVTPSISDEELTKSVQTAMMPLKQAMDKADINAATRADAAEVTAQKRSDALLFGISQLIPVVNVTPVPFPGPQPPTPTPTFPIVFTGPTEAEIGKPITVRVSALTGATSLKLWGAPGQKAHIAIEGQAAVIVALDNSDIWLEADCVLKGVLAGPVQWKITAGKGPQPPPVPDPPKPDPTPAPTATKLYILTFDDIGVRTQTTAQLLMDKAYWNTVIGNGHSYRSIDVGNPAAAQWQSFYTKGGVTPPSMVILNDDKAGRPWIATVPLPANADPVANKAAVDSLIKKYTGK